MGWCGGTEIFDVVAKELLDDEPVNKTALLIAVIDALEDGDWDCQNESRFWEHPTVREIMKERHPSWFEDDA